MRATDEFSAEAMNTLLNEFTKSIQANYEYTNTEIVYACLNTIASVLVNIECPDCRKLTLAHIEEKLPRMMAEAMEQAASIHTTSSIHKH
jgi:hypothetical protein